MVTLQLTFGVADVVGALVVFVVAYVFVRVLGYTLSELSERSVEHRIAIKMLIPVVKTLVYAGALYYVLGPLFALSSAQLLAISGLLGAALGFGLKDLFADVVGGLVMIVERPYQVGDKVEIGDYYGEVTDIGLRATRLQTPNDSLVSVPNYVLFTDSLANANAGHPEMLVVVELTVAVDTDLDRATTIVEEALVTSRYAYVTPDRQYTVLVEDGPYYLTIRGKAYVGDIRNEFAFKSDVTTRVLQKFEQAGVEKPPFGVGAVRDAATEAETSVDGSGE